MRLLTFGEAMLRFAPLPAGDVEMPDASAGVFLRSVGGDELNVAVATARLGCPAPQWVSALPTGPLGDAVSTCGTAAGVDMSCVVRVPDAELGTFYVLPEKVWISAWGVFWWVVCFFVFLHFLSFCSPS
jgi:sugar/nucleoside kinase (ribokinase family)